MLMVFGIMQTSGLVCMNNLTKIRKFSKFKLVKKQNLGKTFKRYNSTSTPYSPGLIVIIGAISCWSFLTISDYNVYKKNQEVKKMCETLYYLLENEPQNVKNVRIIINQPRLIKLLGSESREPCVTTVCYHLVMKYLIRGDIVIVLVTLLVKKFVKTIN